MIQKHNNHLKYTHSQILKLDISTQASSWQQATVSLTLCCCNEENSNWQHVNNNDRWHDNYMQWINNHLDEVIKINDNLTVTEI